MNFPRGPSLQCRQSTLSTQLHKARAESKTQKTHTLLVITVKDYHRLETSWPSPQPLTACLLA